MRWGTSLMAVPAGKGPSTGDLNAISQHCFATVRLKPKCIVMLSNVQSASQIPASFCVFIKTVCELAPVQLSALQLHQLQETFGSRG